MPNVGGVQYPYTPQGAAAAQQAQRQIQKTGPYIPQPTAGLDPARMSPPLTSPSHPMAQRQVPDLQPAKENYNAMNFYGWRGQAGNPLSPRTKAPTYEDRYTVQSDPNRWTSGAAMRGQYNYRNSPSNPAVQRSVQDLQPYNDPPIQGTMSGQGILGTLGYSNEAMPSRQDLSNVVAYGDSGLRYGDNRIVFSRPQLLGGPSSPWYQPIAQAPRGRTIETTDPGVGYGNSPSNPNWGQERGGSVGRMGPMNVPVSTNYSAISPSNRIAGNIAAVMSGRQGPSPGTSPHLNQSGRLESSPNARPWTGFGPTGQPVPSKQPVQKGIPRG